MLGGFEERLDRYAEILVKVGLRVEPGERLLIQAGVDDLELVRRVTAHAYRSGAVNVDIIWSDSQTERSRFVEGPASAADEVSMRAAIELRAAERGDSLLWIDADDPELMSGIDPRLVAGFEQRHAEATEDAITGAMAERFVWTVAAAANPAWARRVFPDLSEEEAVARLWDAVFASCRVDVDDPFEAWSDHVAELEARSTHLTERRYDKLRYRAPGTDLTIGLPKAHRWRSGAFGKKGSVPNLPTEEVFTTPHRARADGQVRSTKPLSHFGTIIDDFELHFEDGVVVSATARVGQDALNQILEMDEGSVRLGEVALVPQSSLVAAQGLVWRNTLLDENEACHLALGRGIPSSVEGGADLSAEEQLAAGINHSELHVDFVVGSSSLDVYGITDTGAEEELLRQGEWAFGV